MKTLTIAVADDLYERATQKAAATEMSLAGVVQDLLARWTEEAGRPAGAEQQQARFQQFLDELAARPLKPGPSVGPLNREELYQRGVPGY